MNDYVKSDLMRYYGKYDSATFIKAYLLNETFRFQYALRIRNATYRLGGKEINWIFFMVYKSGKTENTDTI